MITPSEVIWGRKERERHITEQSLILKKYDIELVIDGSEIINDNAKEKAAQLEGALNRDDIDAIICYTWGYNANEVLPYLNFDKIKKNRKPIIGHSDISVLLNAIRSKTWCVSFHFPTLDELCSGDEEVVAYSLNQLTKAACSHQYCVEPSQTYQDQWSALNSHVNTNVYQNKWREVISAGTTSGRVLGWNISSFRLLESTQFFQPRSEGIILFLEDDDVRWKYSLKEFERNFEAITQTHWFENVKWIMLGRFQTKSWITQKDVRTIVEKREVLRCKVVMSGLDFGHTQPNFVVPIGWWVDISTSERKIEFITTKNC